MVIGVDAGCLGVEDDRLKAGVYYVAYNLLKELSKIDKKNAYLLYSLHPIPENILKQFPKKSKNIVLPSFGWLNLQLPISFVKQKPDVFLALSQAMPKIHPFKTIGFIHALDFIPEFHLESNTKLKNNSEYLIKEADTIITSSEFLKKSLKKKYHIKNTIVIHLGVDQVFSKKIKAYKMDTPYFIFVGTFKPSKNIPVLIKAFSLFLKSTNKQYKLLLIGSDFWLDKNIEKIIKNNDLEKNIVTIPSIPNSNLPPFYMGATSFISPSIYEGFGMTFLEAMASCTPIIGSRVGAIPEVVGDAGILIGTPKDYKGISNAMIKLATNESLRKKYIKIGKDRVKNFSWEKFANNFYKEIKKYEV